MSTWALEHLRHSGTWALKALRYLGTRALKALEQSGTWALEALYLADSQDLYFSSTEVSDILKGTTALNIKKNGTFGNIPTKLLKEVSVISAPALNDIWNNEIITQRSFPNNLKLANVTPVFKKDDASLLKNYRPVSVLPVVSKCYERLMQKQILEYIDKHLSLHLEDIEKGTVHQRL